MIYEGPLVTYFNLQTTGFELNAQIIQISAMNKFGEFYVYVLPTTTIHPRASAINGFTMKDGRLYQHGEEKLTMPLKVALLNFSHFLSQTVGGHVLVSHNGRRFHNKRLMAEISVMKLNPTFKNLIIAFNDTLPLLRRTLKPHSNGVMSLKLRDLDRNYLNSQYTPTLHVKTTNLHLLRDVVHLFNLDLQNQNYWVFYRHQRALHYDLMARNKVKKTLEPLRGFLSDFMIGRIAYHKITLKQLVAGYKQGGEDAVKDLLRSPNNCRKMCVTRVERILNNAARGVKEIFDAK